MKKLIYILFLTVLISSCSTYNIVDSLEQLPVQQGIGGKVVEFSIDMESLGQDSVGLYGDCTIIEHHKGDSLVEKTSRYIYHHMDIGMGYHLSILPNHRPFIYHRQDSIR